MRRKVLRWLPASFMISNIYIILQLDASPPELLEPFLVRLYDLDHTDCAAETKFLQKVTQNGPSFKGAQSDRFAPPIAFYNFATVSKAMLMATVHRFLSGNCPEGELHGKEIKSGIAGNKRHKKFLR